MPRYIVEQTFPDRLNISANAEGVQMCLTIINNDALDGVTWIHSYVTLDKRKTFCLYDAPTPEAVRRTALRNGWPVDRITEVRLLDPHFHI